MRNSVIIAFVTFKEAIRQRLMLLIFLVSLALVLLSNYLLKLDMGHARLQFIADFGAGALAFFGSIISITVTCQLIHSEIDTKTLMTLRSKPVMFVQFVFGKIFGISALLMIFTGVIGISTIAMIYYTQYELSWASAEYLGGLNLSISGMAAYLFLQWFKLVLISALTSLVCSLSGSIMFSMISSFMLLAASMMNFLDFGSSVVDRNFGHLIASVLLPNMNVFAASEGFVFGGFQGYIFFSTLLYSIIYAVAMAMISAYCFTKKLL